MFSVRTDVRTGAGTFASRSWSLVDRGEVVRGDTGFYVNISYHMPTQGFGGVARVARQKTKLFHRSSSFSGKVLFFALPPLPPFLTPDYYSSLNFPD